MLNISLPHIKPHNTDKKIGTTICLIFFFILSPKIVYTYIFNYFVELYNTISISLLLLVVNISSKFIFIIK